MNGGEHLILGIQGPELSPDEHALFQKLQPAGYILFTRNIVSAAQTRQLCADLRTLSREEPIIAIDQEGGRVTRTREISPALPSAKALAEKNDFRLISQAACLCADQLRLLGINMNFAPVLDLDHHPDLQNSLRSRCWGRDSQRVIDKAGTWNRWLRKRSIASCAKHFPACGRATSDPHHDLPIADISKAELQREDVIPYTALMPELDAIMLAHVLFPQLDAENPASLSPRVVTDFLRDQLGFEKHLVLTDDLDMGAIRKRYQNSEDAAAAIRAGNDIALICHEISRAEEAADAISRVDGYLLDRSQKRLQRFRKRLSPPLKWTDEKWEKLKQDITELSAQVPEPGEAQATNSPVADY
jgi:beta-N-acetylhexosaminidase